MEVIDKYFNKVDLFNYLLKNFIYVMYSPPVLRISQLLNLFTSLLIQFLEKQETLDKTSFERFFVYCIAWSIGGLFETEEREKFHKYLEQRNAPLPPISA